MSTNDNNGSAVVEDTKPEKLDFTDAQQAYIQTLIDRAVGKTGAAYKKKMEPLETTVSTLTQELEDAKEQLKNAKTSGDKSDAKDLVESLQGQLDETRKVYKEVANELESYKKNILEKDKLVERTKEDMIEVRKINSIKLAMGKIEWVDDEAVEEITKKFVKYDPEEDDFFVVSEPKATQPRLNAAMQKMTLQEFYQDYAQNKKHLVKGDLKFGTGSGESNRSSLTGKKYTTEDLFTNKPGSGKRAMELKRLDPKMYQQLRQTAIEEGKLAKPKYF